MIKNDVCLSFTKKKSGYYASMPNELIYEVASSNSFIAITMDEAVRNLLDLKLWIILRVSEIPD